MNILNQFSYPLVGIGVLFIAFIFFRRFLHARWYVITTVQLTIAVLLIAGFILLRPDVSNISDAQQAIDRVGNGKPTFLEFFSNYCAGCLTFEPVVNGIIEDVGEEFNILRVDIHTSAGRTIREELGFSFTPEFVLYDAAGNEIWRDHIPPTQSQLDRANTP